MINPARETLVSGNLVWPTALAVDFTGKQAANTGAVKCITFNIHLSPGPHIFLAAVQCDLCQFFAIAASAEKVAKYWVY